MPEPSPPPAQAAEQEPLKVGDEVELGQIRGEAVFIFDLEEVATVITRRPGSTLDADELRRFLTGKIAPFKIPSQIAFSEERLPRNPSGKILKRELRDTYFASAA